MREMENSVKKSVKMTPKQAGILYEKARAAGLAALEATRPVPMIVGSAIGLSDKIDYSKPTYYEEGGVCGFAWVTIAPGRGPFVTWCKKNGVRGHAGYYGGYEIWVSEGGQSMQRKEAYARAFANVLREAGINAYPGSRMD
jgi:hypothetical protein